jgi:hypothetical protein
MTPDEIDFIASLSPPAAAALAMADKYAARIAELEQAKAANYTVIEARGRRIAQLEEALSCLLPGLVLDLRYADDDDDKDALRSRIETIETALGKEVKP